MGCRNFLPLHRLPFLVVLMYSHLSIFAFVACNIGIVFKKLLLKPMSRGFFLFSSRNFTVLGLICKSLIHFLFDFWVKYNSPVSYLCVQIHSLLSTIFWRDYSIPILYTWHLCQVLVDRKCVSLFLGSLFCSLGLSVPHYFDYHIFFWGIVLNIRFKYRI